MFSIHVFVGTNLHTDDWSISKSTLKRVWSTHFFDAKIPATNRFSKCQTCEILKKMIYFVNIEVGHNLSQEEIHKLGNSKVCSFYNINFSCLLCFLFNFFCCVFFRKEPKHMLNNCSSNTSSTFEDSAISLNQKK